MTDKLPPALVPLLLRLRRELGGLGATALVLLAAAGLFHVAVLEPLQARSAALQERAARQPPAAVAGAAATTADKVAAVYRHLRKDEATADWLAKLHGIALATGLQVNSASYRAVSTEGRIQRYEIVLPVAGSYAQIRDFLQRSLAEIPVMSADHVTLKRESGEKRNPAALSGELRLTLHTVKS